MATIAVLPVLIGLAVDYAIQSQARFDEVLERERAGPEAAAPAAAAAGGPTIATAGVATAAGFLVLLLSPVPMVSGFGVLLVVGIVIALRVRLHRRLRRARALRRRAPPAPRTCRRAFPACARGSPAWAPRLRARGAGRALGDRWGACADAAPARAERALAYSVCAPAQGAGSSAWPWRWWGGGWTPRREVVSDVRELVPSDLQALRDVNALQEETGVSGEIDVTVRADDITEPEVIAWMSALPGVTLKAAGYKEGDALRAGEGPARAVPGAVAAHLLRTVDAREQTPGAGAARRGAALLLPGRGHRATARPPTWRSASGCSRWTTRRRWSRRSRTASIRPPGVRRPWSACRCWPRRPTARCPRPLRRVLALLAALAAVFLVLCGPSARRRAHRGGPPARPACR